LWCCLGDKVIAAIWVYDTHTYTYTHTRTHGEATCVFGKFSLLPADTNTDAGPPLLSFSAKPKAEAQAKGRVIRRATNID